MRLFLGCLILSSCLIARGSADEQGAPAPAPASAESGWAAWRRGDVERAAQIADKAVSRDATDASARHLLVLSSFVSGEYQRGLAHYAQLDPEYSRIKELDRLVVEAHVATRRYDRAVDFAKQRGRPERVVRWLERQRARPLRVSLVETTEVPFSQNHLIPKLMPAVPITINGRQYLGHLDTGGSFIAMSPKMARELQIETEYIGDGNANARRTTIEAGIVKELRIGAATLENVPAIALASLEGALRGNGRIEDLVILGTKVLEQFLVTWDNEKQRLVLSPRHDPAARKQHFDKYVARDAKRMAFHMVPDHYLVARGSIAGKEAAFFVDTGLVTTDEKGRQPALTTSVDRLRRFVGGDEAASGFIDSPGEVRLGPSGLTHQGILVGKRSFSFGGIQLDALLAHGYLKHFVWTLDFDTRSWYLKRFREPAQIALEKKAKKETKPAPKPVSGPLKSYVGVYDSKSIQSQIQVSAQDDRLQVVMTGNLRGAFSLKLVGKHEFEAEKAPQKLSFAFAVKKEKVAKLSVTVGGQGPFEFVRK